MSEATVGGGALDIGCWLVRVVDWIAWLEEWVDGSNRLDMDEERKGEGLCFFLLVVGFWDSGWKIKNMFNDLPSFLFHRI